MSEHEEDTELLPDLDRSMSSDCSLSKDLPSTSELNFLSQTAPIEPEEDNQHANIIAGHDVPVANQGGNQIGQSGAFQGRSTLDDAERESEKDLTSGMLYLCEYCQGPITSSWARKTGFPANQFCSKACAMGKQSATKATGNDNENITTSSKGSFISQDESKELDDEMSHEKNQTDDMENAETDQSSWKPPVFDWEEYKKILESRAAPLTCFSRLTKDVKGLTAGMKLEALDKNNPCNYCVATVIDVVGHRLRIRYDGFGHDESQDFWANFQAEELFPIGWCAGNSYPLQPPTGISSTLEDWKTFLTKTLTGALAAPTELFRENEKRMKSKVHTFQVGMKVECIHPKKAGIICPATITKSLGPYYYQVTTEALPNLPSFTFYGHCESSGIFPFGWCAKHGVQLTLPAYVDGGGLSKEKYMAMGRSKSAPELALIKRSGKINRFKVGQKLEAVDLEEPFAIRVATVFSIIGRIILLLFDGQGKFQYIDCESEDIAPTQWCLRTGHPLHTSYGVIEAKLQEPVPELDDHAQEDPANKNILLPSFHSVLGKQSVFVKDDGNKKIKARINSNVDSNDDLSPTKESTDGNPEIDQSSTEELLCVYYNKTCVLGNFLNPEKVRDMPIATLPGKPPAVVRYALEQLLKVCFDPDSAMEAIQEGFGPRLFSKGKNKILKKGLFRNDTKLRASRFLKKLCKRLKSCEYFLSFDTAKDPCPLECQTSGTTNLETFMAMKVKKAKDLQMADDVKKKRGRPKKGEEYSKPEMFMLGKDVVKNTSAISGSATKTVRVLPQPAMYNGRPLLPIAPGGTAATIVPVSIVPAGSITNVKHPGPPPPYDTTSKGQYQPLNTNTIVTNTTHPRMVAPFNVRMISPSPNTHIIHQGEVLQTMPSQGLTTVLVMSKGQVTNRLQPAINTMSGTGYPGQQMRVPRSPGPIRYPISKMGSQNVIVSKEHPNAIKIHGPMIDQPPGAMCPVGHENNPRKLPIQPLRRSSVSTPQVILPKEEGTSTIEYTPHHHDFSTTIRPISPARLNYMPLKHTGESLESSTVHHAMRRSPMAQNMADMNKRHLGQPVHIHHSNLGQFRSSPADEATLLSNKSPHRFSVSPNSGVIHIPDQEDSSERTLSTRSAATMTSPIPDNLKVKHINLSSHLSTGVVSSHVHHHHHTGHNYLTTSLANHASHVHSTSSRLHAVSSNHDGSQSATSPLLSPPPLIRPVSSGSQRSVAMRSPPNLTPSNVIRPHFDFPPTSSEGYYVPSPSHIHQYHNRHQRPLKVRHLSAGDAPSNVIVHRGQQVPPQHMMQQTEPEMADKGVGTHGQGTGPPTSGVTVTLTYIPLKGAHKDKIVYVPVNQNSGQNNQMLFYKQPPNPGLINSGAPNSGHHHHHHHHHHIDSNNHPNAAAIDGHGNRVPFSGVTRKFTVRSLQRDPMLSSGQFTTIRIQGSSLKGAGDTNSDNVLQHPIHPNRTIKTEEVEYFEQKKENDLRMNDKFVPSGEMVIDTVKSEGGFINKEYIKNNESSDIRSKERGEIIVKDSSDGEKEECMEKDYEMDDNQELDDEEGNYDDEDDDDDDDDFEDDDEDDEEAKKQNPNWIPRRRRKGLKRLFTRKKGATSGYKMKYKQAIQQAKIMRQRRPNFSKRLSGGSDKDRDLDHMSDIISDHHTNVNGESIHPMNSPDTHPINPPEIHTIDPPETRPMDPPETHPIDAPETHPINPPEAHPINPPETTNSMNRETAMNVGAPKGNIPGRKSVLSKIDPARSVLSKIDPARFARRRKRRAISTHEDDYFYGKWILSADGQLRKKRKKHMMGLQEKKAGATYEIPQHGDQPAFETPLSLEVPQRHPEIFRQHNGFHQNHQNLLTVAQPPIQAANGHLQTKFLTDPLTKVKLPSNPEIWSEEQVARFISATECSAYAETLKEQEIDGSALLLLTRESLMEFAGMKLGPALKICGYVASLKGRIRMHHNMTILQNAR